MTFRLATVLLFLFLSTLVLVSSFIIWTSFQNSQETLEIEQLKQVSRLHDLSQQFLAYKLQTEASFLSDISTHQAEDIEQALFEKGIDKRLWNFVTRFELSTIGDVLNTEHFGDFNEEPGFTGIQDLEWSIVRSSQGWVLLYQKKLPFKGLNRNERYVQGGVYLENNTTLLNKVLEASGAHGHALYFDGQVLSSTRLLEPGVEEQFRKITSELRPVFASYQNEFVGDILPLRIGDLVKRKGLYLATITLAEGTAAWRKNFETTTIWNLQFIGIISAVTITLMVRFIHQKHLKRLLKFSSRVRNGQYQSKFKRGWIKEFNEVAAVIEEIVEHVARQTKYLESVVNSTTSPIVAFDENSRIIICNDAAKKLMDTDFPTHRPAHLKECFDRKNYLAFFQAASASLRGIKTPYLELEMHSDRQKHQIIWNIMPVTSEEVTSASGIAMGQDITQRRKDENRLQLAAKVFDNTQEAILVTDTSGTIVEVNRAFTEITGFGRDEVLGKNPNIMKSDYHDASFYKNMWGNLTTKGYWRGEVWDVKKNGEVFPKWLSINEVLDKRGVRTNYVAVFTDISRRKRDQEKLEQLAHYDPLTDLPNKVLFTDRLETALAHAKRKGGQIAILFIDLDKFKQVNDSLGHLVGDLLLKQVAERICSCVRETDTVSRLSGDEFTCFISDFESNRSIEVVASRIVELIASPFTVNEHMIHISASVGIAVYPIDGVRASELLRHSDIAMYRAKKTGRNNFQFFTREMNEQVQLQLAMVNDLHNALTQRHIVPYFQQKIDINTLSTLGVEALARWETVDGEFVPPSKFIPVAEEHGLITSLGEEIFQEICLQAKIWKNEGVVIPNIAFNLSAQQFHDKKLIEFISETISDNALSGDLFEIEVTENVMMENIDEAIHVLKKIKDMGIRVSIDDFGTGYSSLSYLKTLPVDTLKIDRSFVQDITHDLDDAAIVSTIISLADKLRVSVVAEGVERQDQLKCLKDMGCQIAQGFLFGKPMPARDLTSVLREDPSGK